MRLNAILDPLIDEVEPIEGPRELDRAAAPRRLDRGPRQLGEAGGPATTTLR